jgi:hypothetical protein
MAIHNLDPGAVTPSGDGLKYMKESKDITARERASA